MKACLVALVVSGCAATTNGPAVIIEREVTRIPAILQDCPRLPPSIPPLPKTRTLETAAEWMRMAAERTKEVETVAALCRQRLLSVNELVGHREEKK